MRLLGFLFAVMILFPSFVQASNIIAHKKLVDVYVESKCIKGYVFLITTTLYNGYTTTNVDTDMIQLFEYNTYKELNMPMLCRSVDGKNFLTLKGVLTK